MGVKQLFAFLNSTPLSKSRTGVMIYWNGATYEYTVMILTKKRNIVVIDKIIVAISSFEDLIISLKDSDDVALLFEGKNIVHKKYSATDKNEKKYNIELILPNANPKDFYVQYYENEKWIFSSISRRELIDSFIADLSIKGINVNKVVFGFYEFDLLLDIMGKTKTNLAIQDRLLSFESNCLDEYGQSFDESQNIISIAEENIDSKYAGLYASLLMGMLPYSFFHKLKYPIIESVNLYQQQNINYRKSIKALKYGLSGIIFVLLVTYLFSYSLNKTNRELSMLEQSIKDRNIQLNRIADIDDQIIVFAQNEEWFNWMESHYYVDYIAKEVPDDIILTELTLHAYNETKSRELRSPVFEAGVIKIKGSSSDIHSVNEFALSMKAYKWVSNIQIIDYEFDSNQKRGFFNLYIKIKGIKNRK